MLAADAPSARSPLDVVSLSRLMERTAGRPEVVVGLIDGPLPPTTPILRPKPSDRLPRRDRTFAARPRGGTRAWHLCRRYPVGAT